jgi:hypothetical protein
VLERCQLGASSKSLEACSVWLDMHSELSPGTGEGVLDSLDPPNPYSQPGSQQCRRGYCWLPPLPLCGDRAPACPWLFKAPMIRTLACDFDWHCWDEGWVLGRRLVTDGLVTLL